MPEFQPYGKEWEAEMMKFKKVDVIKILRGAIFGKIYEINAAMEAGKMLKQQRDEAYAELSRLKAQNETLKANIVMHWKEHERKRNETDRDRIAALEANNKFLRGYRNGLVDRIKELEKEVERITAYNRKLLDENITLLNERNAARRKITAEDDLTKAIDKIGGPI